MRKLREPRERIVKGHGGGCFPFLLQGLRGSIQPSQGRGNVEPRPQRFPVSCAAWNRECCRRGNIRECFPVAAKAATGKRRCRSPDGETCGRMFPRRGCQMFARRRRADGETFWGFRPPARQRFPVAAAAAASQCFPVGLAAREKRDNVSPSASRWQMFHRCACGQMFPRWSNRATGKHVSYAPTGKHLAEMFARPRRADGETFCAKNPKCFPVGVILEFLKCFPVAAEGKNVSPSASEADGETLPASATGKHFSNCSDGETFTNTRKCLPVDRIGLGCAGWTVALLLLATPPPGV